MNSYEFDLFAFWEDLEYADDTYWDVDVNVDEDPPPDGKRKRREAQKKGGKEKRRKVVEMEIPREDDPLLLVSRAERNRVFFEPPPLLEDNAITYAFLPDWRERYANVDDVLEGREMPVDMKRAAEAWKKDFMEENMEKTEVEDDWEDDDHDDKEEQEVSGIDTTMLQVILQQKLAEAGLEGENEEAFMQVIDRIMSGEGDVDDATGQLATSLLGRLSTDSGSDSALLDWLSQQGVALEGEEEEPEGQTHHSQLSTRHNAQDSPIDSVVGEAENGKSTRIPFHSPSPTSSAKKKKRGAATMDEHEKPSKKQKKVTFDVSASSSSSASHVPAQIPPGAAGQLPTSEDPLMPENTLAPRPTRNPRKRKAGDGETTQEIPPGKKKRDKKEVDGDGELVVENSREPPERRTRTAKAKTR